jgi:hypothetical protein
MGTRSQSQALSCSSRCQKERYLIIVRLVRYSCGVKPVCFLKNRVKYGADWKPTFTAMSWTLHVVSSRSRIASVKRRSRMRSEMPMPVTCLYNLLKYCGLKRAISARRRSDRSSGRCCSIYLSNWRTIATDERSSSSPSC